jgi:hypothetical protein
MLKQNTRDLVCESTKYLDRSYSQSKAWQVLLLLKLPLGNNEELNNVKKKDDWIGYPFVKSSKEVSNIPGSYVAMEIGTELLFSLMEMLQNESTSCDCPLKCEYTVYETSLSMGKFPSAFISKDLNKMLKETEEYIVLTI